ncbi:M48 family metalloprotease [Desulfosediminicola sp.]|uniref:beta-barrel assembly-enhancing protease n=1 Tax=Desulfosediminicola sp. TaxID=2886825 RepID=UPI003AF20CB7
MRKLFYKYIAALLVAIMIQAACLQSAFALSVGEERKIGEQLLYQVRAAFPLVDDPDLVIYLRSLGKEVLEVAGLQYFDYHFYIVQSGDFNAFAAPSGLIFFYTGLIGAMESEDELVSVLAHEIGHVARRHLAGRMEKGKLVSAASLAVALAALALGGGAATQALLTGSLAAGQSATLHYSRKHEEEADLMAYGWMKEMGRHPVGQEKMLETMRRVSRYRSDKLPQYLLTHPNPEFRLNYVQSLMVVDQEDLVDFESTDDLEFLRFKYRIMSSSDGAERLREYLVSQITDSRLDAKEKLMAKYGLSQVERRLNNYARSEILLDQVIAAIPDWSILKTDRGVLLFEAGRVEEARVILAKAFSENPKDMYAAYNLARVNMALGNLNEAENLFRVVSYDLPQYAKVYFELGKIATAKKEEVPAAIALGKYNLYEGKLKLAEFSLKQVMQHGQATEQEKNEAGRLLETIKNLQEK